MGPLQQYLNSPQFKWAPYNNIDPGCPGPSVEFLPTNLNGPLQEYLEGPQFKWVSNKNIDPEGREPSL